MTRLVLARYRPGDLDGFTPRPDMARQWGAEGWTLPPGPCWTLRRDGVVLGLGGLEPAGAATSLGWFLAADLDRVGWAAGRRALRQVLVWARSHAIRRIFVLASGDVARAAPMLQRLGFEPVGRDGDDLTLTLEIR